jgi:hypothetical protein
LIAGARRSSGELVGSAEVEELEEREPPDKRLDGESDEELAQDVSLCLNDCVEKMGSEKK